uniref:Membrane dipeptidase n=1 Tax=Chromera velia CCMP2878 TaxID=1169474 RepID=A0A0G4HXX3_9ALVE|eukprot:Cvel_9373.t1-p1 / transcript=Cvel_9373.t1 / gene=Cvel_9373 / organism=Chromera_velia_CCMP2878 / gene_product=hypothetical protein / transcript_product=hypothetical protein / location=Cvel_scaffold538:32175-36944(-) / protein_length=176 / sequence_SO=supercontig / SO=protein_coding / is_pseudo=false
MIRSASPAFLELNDSLPFVSDLHCDALLWRDRSLLEENSIGHVDLPRLLKENVALQVFTVVSHAPLFQNNDRNVDGQINQVMALGLLQRWGWGEMTFFGREGAWTGGAVEGGSGTIGLEETACPCAHSRRPGRPRQGEGGREKKSCGGTLGSGRSSRESDSVQKYQHPLNHVDQSW